MTPSELQTAAPETRARDHVPFPSDRARLELARGGRAHAMPASLSEPRICVIVLVTDARRLSTTAVASALDQIVRVGQVLVAATACDAFAEERVHEAAGRDGRVRVLNVTQPGPAPAAPRSRRFVRHAQLLRAAMPFVDADWITVTTDEQALSPDFLARALARARAQTLELSWADDDVPPAGRGFAGVLWASVLSALAPSDHAGWDGEPSDSAWWARLAEAGVRAPGAAPLPRDAR